MATFMLKASQHHGLVRYSRYPHCTQAHLNL